VSAVLGRRRTPGVSQQPEGTVRSRLLEGPVSARAVVYCLIGIAALSSVVRIAFVSRVHGPIIFMDELGYERLAQSIGLHGKLALFGNEGLSYSPLYPLVLSPIYALGAAATTAYTLIKSLNAVLISLSVFPIYKIARFVLPRRPSLLVAALSAVAPVLAYSSYVMSESLAYPLCLVAVWSILVAVRAPSVRGDAAVMGAVLLSTAARVQLIVLVPVALTAFLLVPLLDREVAESRLRALLRGVKLHKLAFGAVAAVALVAGTAALLGLGVFSVVGRYANVGRSGLPDLGHTLRVLVEHIAGIDLAVGVVPFIAALVTAYAFARSARRRREHVAFAAVAVSLTVWLLLETAYDAAKFDSPTGDVPRIHERFLIYLLPLFLIAVVAAARLSSRRAPIGVYAGAAAVAAILPAAIRFDTVVNNTTVVDSFGLQPFARAAGGQLVAVPHAALAAVIAAAVFGLLYIQVRQRLRTVVLLVLIAFVLIGGLLRIRIEAFSAVAASLLPARADWVDQAKPGDDVAILTVAPDTALETAFANISIARVYTLCNRGFGAEFGERRVTVDRRGRITDSEGVVRARYVVVPWAVDVQGRVVAWNAEGGLALVAPRNGRLTVPQWNRQVKCPQAAPAPA